MSFNIEQRGQIAAVAGTEAIENGLNLVFKDVYEDDYRGDWPAEFLEAASLQLWNQENSATKIFPLWRRYYNSRSYFSDESLGDKIGYSFPYVMSSILASSRPEDRNDLMVKTVQLITEQEDDIGERTISILIFAADLSLKGAIKEGKRVANICVSINPNLLKNKEALEYIHEALTGARANLA